MKKKIFSLLLGVTAAFFAMAQATLPTSCDFSGSELPSVGWTANAPEYYPASGNPHPAFKFGATGKYLLINVASAPGTMTYDIAGNSFGTGTFEIQESVDGNTYTTSRTHNATDISGNTPYTNKSLTLSSATRFIKFIYVTKAGGNVGLDNVVVNAAAVTAQQMKVNVNGTPATNNSTHYVGAAQGSSSVLPFTVQNTGSQDALSVASIVISGTNAADFSLNNTLTFPVSVAALSTENVGLKFTPSASGSRTATVTITSNDLDFPAFTFNVIGYGDNFASEPSAQPTALNFSNVKTYRLSAAFTAAAAEGYIVLRKKGAPVTEVPVDGTAYAAGDMIGAAKVVKASSATSFVPNDIVANSSYYFAVFAYNGVGQYTNYLTTAPLTGNLSTPATMVSAGEYSGINTASSTLISDLHGLIAPHTQNYYSNYAARMIENFYSRDTTGGKKTITCSYTGVNYNFDAPFNFTSVGMSREHTFANSWFPVDNSDANFYSDYHNLFPVHQTTANEIRSNYPLGIVVSDTIQSNAASYFGKNAQGQWVYEPRNEQKGAAARAMFYMCTRYTENGTTWKLPSTISNTISYGQDQAILKQWNTQFPPSNLEISRNDYIDSLQKNRNPFVDHPEYACFIDFSNMTHLVNGCELGVDSDMLLQAFVVYPNPASSTVTVAVDGASLIEYRIFDTQGRLVKKEFLNDVIAKEINVSSLNKGIYIINVTTEHGDVSKTVVIE